MYWNPPKFIFTIPVIDRPIAFYGLFFFLGFLASYYLAVYVFDQVITPLLKEQNKNSVKKIKGLLSKKEVNKEEDIAGMYFIEGDSLVTTWNLSKDLINTALFYSVVFSIIGSRLFHVFFYDWPYYQNHLAEIPLAFDGGLASHGGILGVFFAWFLFYKLAKKKIKGLSLLSVFDVMVLNIGLALGSIRIGNFFNQEILGKPTDSIFGITFGNPMGGLPIVPRHPVQLYESISYFLICFLLIVIWKKTKLKPGTYFALGNIFYFSARFICEFFKLEQSQSMPESSILTMGQIQSIPFILMGIIVAVVLNVEKGPKHPRF
jgi:phosphatidylglycerol---prolipoprotein diacylglyceryl transferase